MGVALVVLGCRVGSTLARRADAAARAWERFVPQLVVASGGRTWLYEGAITMEADWLAHALVDHGVPRGRVLRERCSHTTKENARFSSSLLARHGVDQVIIVTCSWHLPRATLLFERQGLRVDGWPAGEGPTSAAQRSYRRVREWVATRLDGVRP